MMKVELKRLLKQSNFFIQILLTHKIVKLQRKTMNFEHDPPFRRRQIGYQLN